MTDGTGSEEKVSFFAGLVDFSFKASLARKIAKLLYVIGVLGGGIAVVVEVVMQMQVSPADGLIALVAGILAYFVWILLTRLLLELALLIARIADGIDRATHSGS